MSIDLGSKLSISHLNRDLINKGWKSKSLELVIINRYILAISCGRSEARDARPEKRHSRCRSCLVWPAGVSATKASHLSETSGDLPRDNIHFRRFSWFVHVDGGLWLNS